jgi:lysozyme
MNKFNSNGMRLLRIVEGLRLLAYKDGGGVWTIGYGHTGPAVREGCHITEDEAQKLLLWDLEEAGDAVTRLVTKPLNDNQYSALVCFVFNIGQGKFATSTLLRKLNTGDYDGASKEFGRWNHDNGRVVDGLTLRRKAEQMLFET